MNNLLELIEAIVFASGTGIKKADLLQELPKEVTKNQLNKVCEELEKKYSKNSGILFLIFNDKLQFSTNPMYGEITSQILQKQKEKELTKILLEVLAIIAYKQPITRLEIEDIRGNSSDYAISVLLSSNLIEAVGRKDTIGRPTLYATTDDFLKKFQLHSLDDLPDQEAIQRQLAEIYDTSYVGSDLYKNVAVNLDENDNPTLTPQEIREIREKENQVKSEEIKKFDDRLNDIFDYMNKIEIPDFLADEDIEIIDGDDLNSEQ